MTKKNNELNLREKDPFLARELEQYDSPLPSREWVIQTIKNARRAQSLKALADKLAIQKHEMKFFERRIRAMVRDGQLAFDAQNRLRVGLEPPIERLLLCRVDAKVGFGFAIVLNQQEKQEDLVLNEAQMRDLMHGDIIQVKPLGRDHRGRRECRVMDVVERALTEVVGRIRCEKGQWILQADDKRLTQTVVLEQSSLKRWKPKAEQVVVAKITQYPHENQTIQAQVIEVLGNYADSGMEIEIAVRKHGLPHQFDQNCLNLAKKIPQTVQKSDWKGRVDLRDLPLITIDGEDSRDFDDAVFAEKVGRNYRLVVAIADVSHYVREGDAIDVDACLRATSVYFPRRVIPMLPESLSNGICSLNPQVERLCMVCDAQISAFGNVQSYRFYPAVMRSHGRLTYRQAWQWIEQKEKNEHSANLTVLYKLFQILQKKRQQRGAMEFETLETKMFFNEQGKIEKIEPLVRNPAHKLIEECMLVANVCAADFLLRHEQEALFRNHARPTPERLLNLRQQLALFGLNMDGGDEPTPKDYAMVAEKIAHRDEREVLQLMLLRSMQQAVYEPENEGHFGLAYEHYTHFTSPIRRYPDLLVHRAIKAVLAKKAYVPTKTWQELGMHASFCERRADDASRDVENWLKTYFMCDKVGEIFTGKISHLTNFGVFVMLDEVLVEGLIPIRDLGQDYYVYRAEKLAIVGEQSGEVFAIGDRVMVRVARADLDSAKIDLVLVKNKVSKRKKTSQSRAVVKKKSVKAVEAERVKKKKGG